jgi:hypothetical protein
VLLGALLSNNSILEALRVLFCCGVKYCTELVEEKEELDEGTLIFLSVIEKNKAMQSGD